MYINCKVFYYLSKAFLDQLLMEDKNKQPDWIFSENFVQRSV
jgi:hypothetical protein